MVFSTWPMYTWLIGFSALLYAYIGEGPMWGHNDLPKRCEDSWLANILLVNNFFGYSMTVSKQ